MSQRLVRSLPRPVRATAAYPVEVLERRALLCGSSPWPESALPAPHADPAAATSAAAAAPAGIARPASAASRTAAAASAVSAVQAVAPLADAYVRDGSFAGSNFGKAAEVLVKKSGSGFNREGLLKFDLSAFGTSVGSAKLRLFGRLQDSSASNVVTQVYGTAASWSETAVTWNTRPASTTAALAGQAVANAAGQWYEFDVTAYARSELAAGRKVVGLLLRNPAFAPPYTAFNSREASANKPQLLVAAASGVNQPPAVSAGPDRAVTLPNSAFLDGTVSDDGLPAGTLTTSWGKFSGPGTVTFANAAAVDTTATFSAAGTYVLRLTAGDGALSSSDDVVVTVSPSAGQAVTSLTLINADTDQPVPGYNPMASGATLNLATLPSRNLNVRANTSPSVVGSVRFALDGNANFKTESAAPYALAGNNGSNYFAWTPSLGTHTLTVTPYTQANATGTAGAALTVTFTVTDSAAATTVSVTATDPAASEPGTNTGTFTVSRSGGSTSQPLAVAYAVGGSATRGSDYQQIPGSVTIPAGASSATVTIAPVDDATAEGNETVVLTLAAGSPYAVSKTAASAAVTIADNEATSPTAPINWAQVASAPLAREEAQGVSVNGKLYVFGGLYTSSFLATSRVDVYDPATNQWTANKPMPEALTHSATAVDAQTQTVWFVGGYVGDHPGPGTSRVWKYHWPTDAWTRGPDLPAARGAGGAALIGRRLHFFGGMEVTRTASKGEHWALNLDGGTAWVPLAAMPNPRNHLGGIALGGSAYAIGGQTGQEDASVNQPDVHRYDPAANAWTRVADLPAPRSHFNAATFIRDGRITVVGGEAAHNVATDNVWSYDPVANKWSAFTPLPEARRAMVTQLVGTKIVATGGYLSGSQRTTTWVGQSTASALSFPKTAAVARTPTPTRAHDLFQAERATADTDDERLLT